MLCLRKTLIVLSEIYISAFCLFCVLVKNRADIVKNTMNILSWLVWLCSRWSINHFRFIWILPHFIFNHFQQFLNLGPFLIRLEYPPNKLPKETFLHLINDVNISKLTLKRILSINDLIQDTCKWKTIRFSINIKISIII